MTLIYNYSQYPKNHTQQQQYFLKKIKEIVNNPGVTVLYVIKNVKGIM